MCKQFALLITIHCISMTVKQQTSDSAPVSQRRQRRIEPRPQGICTKYFVKNGPVVPEICLRTDTHRQTDRQTNWSQYTSTHQLHLRRWHYYPVWHHWIPSQWTRSRCHRQVLWRQQYVCRREWWRHQYRSCSGTCKDRQVSLQSTTSVLTSTSRKTRCSCRSCAGLLHLQHIIQMTHDGECQMLKIMSLHSGACQKSPLHSSMASSMMAWLKCDHTSTRRCFSSSTSRTRFWYTLSWRQSQTL